MGAPLEPILLEVPSELLTERLLLRAPRPGDGALLIDPIVESARELQPWMRWAQEPPTHESTEAFARKCAADFLARRDLPFFIFSREAGHFIGGTGLHRIDWSVPRFEIGYWCRASMQRRGYVTEAVRALADLALGTLAALRVEIRCDARNAASRRVAERAGFVLEGVHENDALAIDGSARDTCVFARVP